jgi:thiol-disulfide isomerase/thioredoxin
MKKAVFAAIGFALTLVTALPRAQIGKPAPEIGSSSWLNSKALTLAELKGKVVLLEFWTFGCWNCRNVEPFIKAWHHKYAGQGLAVIARSLSTTISSPGSATTTAIGRQSI